MISGLRIIGSGTSSATPALRCLLSKAGPCARCQDAIDNPTTSKNRRNNPSVMVWSDSLNLSVIFDVGKTFRDAALHVPWTKYPPVKAVALTHWHLDAVNGLDDVREFSLEPLPCFCDDKTAACIRRRDPHLFTASAYQKYVGKLNIRRVPLPEFGGEICQGVDMLGLEVDWVPLFHGKDCTAAGYIFNTSDKKRVAYFSDIGRLDAKEDANVLDACANDGGVDVLFIDCMGTKSRVPIPNHFLLHQSVDAVKLIAERSNNKLRQVFLTGIGHADDHDDLGVAFNELLLKEAPELKASLKTAGCAYDGMEMVF